MVMMDGMLSTLAGVVVGFLLSEVVRWRQERQERFSRLVALRVEAGACRTRMETYKAGGKAAPLYRLPTIAAENALPRLIGDGRLSSESLRVLMDYYDRVQEMNRGLERAGAAHAAMP